MAFLLLLGGCAKKNKSSAESASDPKSELEAVEPKAPPVAPDRQKEAAPPSPAEIAIQAAYEQWLASEQGEEDMCDEETCLENMHRFFEGEEFDMECFAAYPNEPEYLYGDLNGDGAMDAVATAGLIQCDGGNALRYARTHIVIFSVPDSSYQILAEPDAFYDLGIGSPFEIKDGVIYAEGIELHEDDPMCCPSIQWDISYELVGNGSTAKLKVIEKSEEERVMME